MSRKSTAWMYKDTIVKEYKQGVSIAKLAVKYYSSEKTVRKVLEQEEVLKAHLREYSPNVKRKVIKERLADVPYSDITRRYGVSKSTIYRWVSHYYEHRSSSM